MGCAFGKEISSPGPPPSVSGKEKGKREEGDLPVRSGRREKSVVGSVSKREEGGEEVQEDGEQKQDRKEANTRRSRSERRRLKANPRLSNPPNNIHGEQVAAGWPPWLSKVAGEAINGWTPRRADTFEKIDKVHVSMVFVCMMCFGFLEFVTFSTLFESSYI